MFNNLYVFAIGGSGERVMYSLLMTLAAGVELGAKKLVPVFVDNDTKSKSLTNCLELIKAYHNPSDGLHSLYQSTWGDAKDKWPSFCKQEVSQPVILNVSGAQLSNLEGIINCPSKSNDPIEARIAKEKDLLFSQADLEMKLDVGFVGNPNIGSVVLNTLSFEMPEFKDNILGSITSNDAVFVIGSLFGGTGAAGFPLIVNKFSALKDGVRPIIGGVALLPYFSTFSAGNSDVHINTQRYDVNSGAFGVKTRAALMYYDRYMRNQMDYMYYVGDDKLSTYPHSVGGVSQDNPANLVELMSAMAIVDFSKKPVQRPASISYLEANWGYMDISGNTTNLSCIPDKNLARAIAKFQLMKVMFENDNFLKYFIESGKQEFVVNIGFTEQVRLSVIGSDAGSYNYAGGLKELFKRWNRWIADLANEFDSSSLGKRNSRTFLIFNDNMVTRDNVTTKFYTDRTGFGIAATKSEGIFKKTEKAVDPLIGDAMLSTYKRLYGGQMLSLTEERILPTELQIISSALDDVLVNKCIL